MSAGDVYGGLDQCMDCCAWFPVDDLVDDLCSECRGGDDHGDQCVDCGGWFPADDLVDHVCSECRDLESDFGNDPDGDGEAYCWYCDSVTQHDEAGACVECGNGE